jgi:hypothetical protein
MKSSMKLNQEIRSNRLLRFAVLGLISLSFLNALYCTLAYEFGWGPKTYLVGPQDRFADLIKASLSYRSVTEGVDRTEQFKHWRPVYQQYYQRPDYGGVASLAAGGLTHFHHPPFSTLLFLLCGLFIVRTANPALALYLFFFIYLLEACCIVWIGIPRARRTRELTLSILVFCLASYPALLTFGRANYINAGLTTLPIALFLVATFAREKAGLMSLLALAVAVNIHPNAIIFLAALPLAFGIRRAITPALQFVGISTTILIASYLAAHKLYPDYTFERFRQGLAVYGKLCIEQGAGVKGGSSLFGLVFVLHRALGFGANSPVEIRTSFILATLMIAATCAAYWFAYHAARKRGRGDEFYPLPGRKSVEVEIKPASAGNAWSRPLAPFFLVSFYCILSPIFADYHLLVFLAPLVLACLQEPEQAGNRSRMMTLIALASAFMLSPKNYWFIQILLNPLFLCGALLSLSMGLILGSRQRAHVTAAVAAADGQ